MYKSSREPVFSRSSLLIDIGSHSLAVAHVKVRGGTVHLDGAKRTSFTKESLDLDTLRERVRSRLPKLLADAHKKFGVPNEVVVVVNGAFTVAQTRSEWVKFDHEQEVKEETYVPLIQSAVTHFFKEVLDEERDEFTALDTSFLCARVNGYDTHEPFGQRATSVGATIHVAAIPRAFYKVIEESVAREFPEVPLSIHSATYALFRALNDIQESEQWMFLDTTGGILEAVFVENGILQNIISFPEGGDGLVERVGKEMGSEASKVRTDLSMLARSLHDEKQSFTLRQALARVVRTYAEEVLPVLTAVRPELPHTVAFLAHPPVAPILKVLFEDPRYVEQSARGTMPALTHIDINWLVKHGVRFGDDTRDVFLGALALGSSRFKSGPIVL